jgi:hypothetical protein
VSTFELLNRMGKLRNMVVHHAAGSGTITTDEALEFLALARGIDRIQPKAVGPQ